jgi:acetylornithine deacetylase/succinyl-diaminopimelate desuccinylase-like protein
MSTAGALAYARAHRRRFIADLEEFIRFPSISGQRRHREDIAHCAQWLASHLRRTGLDKVEVVSSTGAPIVYAEWRRAPSRPTVLMYGHYDVLTADPIGE